MSRRDDDDTDSIEDPRRGPTDYSRPSKKVIYMPVTSSSKETIFDGLIVAAIIALVGAVVTLMLAVNTLQSTTKYQQGEIDKIEHKVFPDK